MTNEDCLRLAIAGARGRVGSHLVPAALADRRFRLIGAISRQATSDETLSSVPQWPTLEELLHAHDCDVLIDFTTPEMAVRNAETALAQGVSVVMGTTGICSSRVAALEQSAISNHAALFMAPNLSRVMQPLMRFFDEARGLFEDATITDVHSTRKQDSPSGTALEWERRLRSGVGNGDSASKSGGTLDISLHSARISAAIDRHEVVFSTPGDILSISYQTLSGEPFVARALDAAYLISGRQGLVRAC